MKSVALVALAVIAAVLPACDGCQVKYVEFSIENARPASCAISGDRLPPSDQSPQIVAKKCSDDPLNPNLGHLEACTCADYSAAGSDDHIPFPVGAFSWQGSFFDSGPATCKGISSNRFAYWDCTRGAEASGYLVGVIGEPDGPAMDSGDDDVSFNMCPIEDDNGDGQREGDVAMHIYPLLYEPIELRTWRSFINPDDSHDRGAIGRLHIEVQGCRFYDGSFDVGGSLPYSTRPLPGDPISVAGDWVEDNGHDDWSEIHEARAIATVHPVSSSLSYAFVNAFFADNSFQRDRIEFDIKVPRSSDPQLNKLECAIDSNAQLSNPCLGPDGVSKFSAVPVTVGGSSIHAACRIRLDRPANVQPRAYDCDGTCPVHEVPCPPPGTCEALPSPICEEQSGCEVFNGLCRPKQVCFAPQDFGDLSPQEQCDQIHFAGVVRAEWVDPGDVWMCSCGCDDPSSTGALITAPVQGCAQAGLDPGSPGDQAIACQQVCSGRVCGAASACDIGSCSSSSAGTAQLVARGTCEPTDSSPVLHVTNSGNYHVTWDQTLSSTTFSLGTTSFTNPLGGESFINVSADGTVIDFANLTFSTPTFEVNGQSVSNATTFEAQRAIGSIAPSGAYVIPASTLLLAMKATNAGQSQATALPAVPSDSTGSINNGIVSLDISFVDPKSGGSLSVHLSGRIDNVPPHASAGGAVHSIECTSPSATPVVLSGASSTDPDPADSISHYQWFANDGTGLGNSQTIAFPLALGATREVTLHVYDHKLGSDQTTTRATVVDTTPPAISISPQTISLWPPDHARVRLQLGADIVANVSDACSATPPTARIVSVASNEPDNGLGDGDTVNDVALSATAVCVRRERSANGTGRTYSITVAATDSSGNTGTRTYVVSVPHDQPTSSTAGTSIAENAACN